MTEILKVLIRSLIALVSLHIFARVIGKQQIGQLTFFDYISGITVGSIAANLSTDLAAKPLPLWTGLMSWMGLLLLVQFISLKNRRLEKLLDGEPVIVVQNGMILEKNLAKLNIPVNTLMAELRTQGIFDLNELEFALLETDGKLSVLKKSQYQPVTPKDLGIPTEYKGLATELIVDGEIIYQNLKDMNLDYTWLMNELNKKGIKEAKDVFYAVLSSTGNLFIDKYSDQKKLQDISDYPGPN